MEPLATHQMTHDGSDEECVLTVPTGVTAAHVTVVGYTAAQYGLEVEYAKGHASPPPSTATPRRARRARRTRRVRRGRLAPQPWDETTLQ